MGIDNSMQFNKRQQQDFTQRRNKNKLSNNVEDVDKIKDTNEQLPHYITFESNSMKT